MSEVQYGFVDLNNLLLEIFIVQEDDTETLERIKGEFNASSYYKIIDFNPVIRESYWDGSRFSVNRPFPSWSWDTSKNDWAAPSAYPTDGLNYYWDEDLLTWVQDIPFNNPA